MGAVKLVATVMWWCGIFFVLILLVGKYNGLVEIQKDQYQCVHGRRLYTAVDRQLIFAVGRLHLFYQPLTYGCPALERFDPGKYRMQDGILVPTN